MKRIAVAMSVVMLASTSAVFAQQAPDQPQNPKKDPNRIICRTEDEIGSRIKKVRICMTAAEWRARAQGIGTDMEKREAAVAKSGG